MSDLATSRDGSGLFIVDNSVDGWTGLEYLRQWCEISRSFDIATGFFEIGSLLALDGHWQQLGKIRVLMGDEVSLRTKQAFATAVSERMGRLDGSLEAEKDPNPFLAGVGSIVEALKSGQIECRVFRKSKFHAKAYITHSKIDVVGARALVGSSNFTRPGLTQNTELNIQVQVGAEVAQLQQWFDDHWDQAEPVTDDVLRVVTRHTAELSPFMVYAKALHETPVAVAIGASKGSKPIADEKGVPEPSASETEQAVDAHSRSDTPDAVDPSGDSEAAKSEDAARLQPAEVQYRRVGGDRATKFAVLQQMHLGRAYEEVEGEGLDRFVPTGSGDYYGWPEITDLFPWIHSGCQLKRTWPISESEATVSQRWRTMLRAVPRERDELMRATDARHSAARPMPIAGRGENLRALKELDRDDPPEGIARYGYRSLDRQWIIADNRLVDRPRPDLWRVRGHRQVFLTTLTSTKLGAGPVLAASPYVPDLHHFSGRGARDVMPLYRDPVGEVPNLADGILEALHAAFEAHPVDPVGGNDAGTTAPKGPSRAEALIRDGGPHDVGAASSDDPVVGASHSSATVSDGSSTAETPSSEDSSHAVPLAADALPTVENLLAYAYALGSTAAFSQRFAEQLAAAAGPVRIPLTSDPALFAQAVALGRDLLWWHTWGERFAPTPKAKLPPGSATELTPVTSMPQDLKDCRYDPKTKQLTVGTGIFAPVSEEVWNFEVSGLRVLRSWLGYRIKNRKGRKSSDLDDIRPTRWTQSNELLLLLSILEHSIEVTPKATELLDQIVNAPLIPASNLPAPTPAQRKPPKL